MLIKVLSKLHLLLLLSSSLCPKSEESVDRADTGRGSASGIAPKDESLLEDAD